MVDLPKHNTAMARGMRGFLAERSHSDLVEAVMFLYAATAEAHAIDRAAMLTGVLRAKADFPEGEKIVREAFETGAKM